MDIAPATKALILGIVEGLTEFLPVPNTGHLILIGQLLDFNDEESKILKIVIRLDATLAVCWESHHKITDVIKGLPSDPRQQCLAINVIVATIPAITLALIFGKAIKTYLLNPIVVASAFIIGGFVILWAEWRERHRGETYDLRTNALLEAAKADAPRVETLDDLRISDAIKAGFTQCSALIPGTSRSGSTITSGLLFGLSRKVATEFSSFLVIPVILGATVYGLYRSRAPLSADDLSILAVGFVVALIPAFFCVCWLLKFIATHDLCGSVWYRIVFGIIVLVTAYTHLIARQA